MLRSSGPALTAFRSPLISTLQASITGYLESRCRCGSGTCRRGMFLKSDGKSSDLSDPQRTFPLEKFCRSQGIDYHRSLLPVKIETFVAYGLAFQRRFVPQVERNQLTRLEREGAQFVLHFNNGERLVAKHVILAVGVLPFRYIPPEFAHLPRALASHRSDFGSLAMLGGHDVAIVGSGSSALDLAALLHERGARATIVTRAPEVVFHGPPPEHRRLDQILRAPGSKIGAGWLLRISDDAPQLIHALPEPLRRAIVRNTLGPSGGYFIKDRVVGKVSIQTGRTISSIAERNDKVLLQMRNREGNLQAIECDHVIGATGYKIDTQRLTFLSSGIQSDLKVAVQAPTLSANFESSVPGLYFVGFSSVGSFGPVMRFVAGTPHPARRLAAHLAKRLSRGVSVVSSAVIDQGDVHDQRAR
jgi:thioredoxin reductase